MKEILLSVISFLNELQLICLRTSIAIVSIQLNGFNYCYLTRIILFNITHCNASLTIQLNIRPLFTQLNDQKVLFLTIRFIMSQQS